jgi:ubiquinone/menaquinone biosynthesis C-methylase UbiE
MSVTGWVKRIFRRQKTTEPGAAYNLWAAGYDNQPGNLMLDLDEAITGDFLSGKDLAAKVIVDIGCGTGRHWNKIFSKKPGRLVGYDVSSGMLAKLKQKFPAAETFLLKGNQLAGMPDHSCDLVISTLTIAHIEKIENAVEEWNRVLKPGGEMFLTDYHPEALAKGGRRTFKHQNKLIAVRNYIHPIEKIKRIAGQLGLVENRFTEKIIDDSVKGYYENQEALAIFEKFRGVPIIYGIHLKKANDPA